MFFQDYLCSTKSQSPRVRFWTHRSCARFIVRWSWPLNPRPASSVLLFLHPKPYQIPKPCRCSQAPSMAKSLDEADVGILCYVSSLPGFRGVLKQRYPESPSNRLISFFFPDDCLLCIQVLGFYRQWSRSWREDHPLDLLRSTSRGAISFHS